jgi:hypothetical protein
MAWIPTTQRLASQLQELSGEVKALTKGHEGMWVALHGTHIVASSTSLKSLVGNAMPLVPYQRRPMTVILQIPPADLCDRR